MKRLSICSIGVVIFFWLMIAGVAMNWAHAPRDQAVMRWVPGWTTQYVWEYTGPRPGPDEVLVLYGRQGTQHSHEDFRLVAYLEHENGGRPQGTAWRQQAYNPANFFTHGTLKLDSWPAGRRLYLGMDWNLGAMHFWENGEWPSAELKTHGWFLRNGKWEQADKAEIGPIDVRIVPADALPDARSFRLLPIGSAIKFGGVLWFLLYIAGLILLPGRRTIWTGWNLLHLPLLWHGLGVIAPSQYFWAGFHIHRIGSLPFWVGILAIQIITFPALQHRWRRIAIPLWSAIARIWNWRIALSFFCLVSACAMICFVSFRVRATYGDAMGALFSPWGFGARHNPLSCGLYYTYLDYHGQVLVLLQGLLGENAPKQNLAEWAIGPYFMILFSPLYLAASAGVAWLLGRSLRQRVMFWAVLLSAKSVLTQFGYLEVYGPALAVLLAAFWALLYSHQRSTDPVLPAAMAFFCYLFHLGTGMLLPIVVLLGLRRVYRYGRSVRWWVTRTISLTVICAAIWTTTVFLLFHYSYDDDVGRFTDQVSKAGLAWFKGPVKLSNEEPFLHWSEPHHMHYYTLKSWEHVSQYIGGVLFAMGPAALFLLLAAARRPWRWLRDPMMVGIVSASALAFVLNGLIYNQFPYPRDWDLFVLPSTFHYVALLALLSWPRAVPKDAGRWILFTVVVYQLWDTGMWLVYNFTWGPAIADRLYGGF